MEKQEKQAIEILHMMCGNNGCVISDSGGKDSSVLKHIALKVKNRYGLEYKIRHNHTTVDAPETVYFIRREKEKYEAMGVPYEIFYPAQSMWQLKVALIRAKKEDGLEIKGKMRDLIASMLNESSTNVARMESINNNATPEIKEQLKSGSIGVTAAYEAAKLPEAEQKEIAEQAAAGKEIRANEIAQKVAEKKATEKADKLEEPRPGDDYEIAHPESITSLCYSCLYYSECNVKTGTCQKCDKYQNKAEAEKTDEQRYSEEQDRIDRETKAKLRQQADNEKMEHLPSDAAKQPKVHRIRLAKMFFEDVASGKKSFELRKNDRGYKQGDILELAEYTNGEVTGRIIKAEVTYMLQEYAGLAEGYCIMAIKVMGIVSETDTKGAEA